MIFLSSRKNKQNGIASIRDSFFREQKTVEDADFISFEKENEYSETMEGGGYRGPDDPDENQEEKPTLLAPDEEYDVNDFDHFTWKEDKEYFV